MMGLGPAELVIILVVIVLLIGAPAITFIVGFALGKNSAAKGASPAAGASAPPEPAPPVPPAEPSDE